jgi:predicted nucleic acid-binding protein
MTIVYDAGVLVAADRDNRAVWAEHRVRLERGILPMTTAPVVAQVSRSPRQPRLRQFLRGCDVVPFDIAQAHPVGSLLRGSGTADVVDAHLMLVAASAGATVLTADPQDLSALAAHIAPPVRVALLLA